MVKTNRIKINNTKRRKMVSPKIKSGIKLAKQRTYNAGKKVGEIAVVAGKKSLKTGRQAIKAEVKACKTIISVIPNLLTTGRIMFVPIICGLMYVDNHVTRILSIIFAILACVSDFFDGTLARKYKATSPFGKCMDPIADKTLVMTLILMLVYLEKAWIFPCIAILFREFVVAGIREFVAYEHKITINVSFLAKVKTATQMIALLFLMILGTNQTLKIIGNCLLSIAAILALITSCQYIMRVKKFITFDVFAKQ